jgi:serine/threonine protein kinase
MKITSVSPEGPHTQEIKALAVLAKELPKDWFAFSSFEMVGKDNGGEVDLVICAIDRLIVVEIKDWFGELQSDGNSWYHNGNRYSSPVKLVGLKAKKLASRLQKFLGREQPPYVDSCVLLTGSCKRAGLDEDDRVKTFELDYFVTIGKAQIFRKEFFVRSYVGDIKPLEQTLHKFFMKSGFQPLYRSYNDYRPTAKDAFFAHPQNIYGEYFANKVGLTGSRALLRVWNFNTLGEIDPKYLLMEHRRTLALREENAINYLMLANPKLDKEQVFLKPLSNEGRDSITDRFFELYDLPHGLFPLKECIAKFGDTLMRDSERVDVALLLINHLASLHDLEVAHRDLGPHSIWIEVPSRVSITGFAVSSFPEQQTVSSISSRIRASSMHLPEDVYGVPSDHYRRDIFLLGCCVHEILFGRPPALTENLATWTHEDSKTLAGRYSSWFQCALNHDPICRYSRASDALKAFAEIVNTETQSRLSIDEFRRFFVDTIPWTKYPPSEAPRTRPGCVSYRSLPDQSCYVKIWDSLRFNPIDPDSNYQSYSFLKKISLASNSGLDSLPEIIEFGLSSSTGGFVALKYYDGVTLDSFEISELDEDKIWYLIMDLLKACERLHGLDLYHGDIKPSNLLVVKNEEDSLKIKILDLFDYVPEGVIRETPAYLPPDDASFLTPRRRDLFALAMVIKELRNKWQGNFSCERGNFIESLINDLKNHSGDDCPLAELNNQAINIEALIDLTGIEHCTEEYLGRLVPEANVNERDDLLSELFRDAEQLWAATESEYPKASILIKDTGETFIIKPGDQGLAITIQKLGRHQLNLFIVGKDLKLVINLNTRTRTIIHRYVNKICYNQYVSDVRRADLRADFAIEVENGSGMDYSNLFNLLIRIGVEFDPLESNVVDLDGNGTVPIEVIGWKEEKSFDIAQVWRVMLESEEGILPETNVPLEGINPSENYYDRRLRIPISSFSGTIDIDEGEEVEIQALQDSGEWRILYRTTKIRIRGQYLLIDFDKGDSLPKAGSRIRIQSRRQKGSFERRMRAVERILSERAVVPDLQKYLGGSVDPIKYSDLGLEKLEDYGLNSDQLTSLKTAITAGPIALVQGPPGTGKTNLISALVHFLVQRDPDVKILVVSQSHEAVNNMTENIVKQFRFRKEDPSIVRVGMKSAVTDDLSGYHTSTLRNAYRNRFKSSIVNRVSSVATKLGLDYDFVAEFTKFRQRIEPLIGFLYNHNSTEERTLDHTKTVERFQGNLRKACEQTGFVVPKDLEDPSALVKDVEDFLCKRYSVHSPAAVSKLGDVISLALEWVEVLAAERSSFDQFLVATKSIIAGTCVGIGKWDFRVEENRFDWAIIDETARAGPGDLAISMQVARRSLLVGDHHQLPPMWLTGQLEMAEHMGISRDHLRTSDFQRLFEGTYGKSAAKTLRTQYRMVEPISRLISSCFYSSSGGLETGRGASPEFFNLLPSTLSSAVTWVDTAGGETETTHATFDEKEPDGISVRNQSEADSIVRLIQILTSNDEFVDQLKKNGEKSGSDRAIGIIATYRAQCDLINKRILDSSIPSGVRDLCKVDTVDSYQGRENQIIIFSPTRSNTQGNIGFMKSFERINVSLSRAKERLYIVGSYKFWNETVKQSPLTDVSRCIAKWIGEKDAGFSKIRTGEITDIQV